MSEPLVFADVWRPVVEAAGFRCQCTGQCGTRHSKTAGRCPREQDQYGKGGRIHLAAAPADQSVSAVAAAQLPAAALRAWCPECHAGAQRKAARSVPEQAVDALFDL
ncbi:hypothetical protein [Streptomyces sp. NPDC048639]|uniref:hypothetical protein n=1 Tax=Streptomyces sp. NPDC048639 TaxID=3365581 RepID=UPI00371DF015